MKPFKTTLFALFVAFLTLGGNSLSYAQRAESLNLNKFVQPSYNCWGLLADGCPNAEKLGLKVGLQYYCFNKYSFFEAIDLTRALGLHYIEAILDAKMTTDSDDTISVGMSQEAKNKLNKKLKDSGVEILSIYCSLNGSGEGFEELVKFCKEMGWMIVTDPKRENNGGKSIDFYEEILNKYGVKMALTNHPRPAAYWNPDFTIEDVKGRSENIGASVDVGHYMRGGYDAFDVAKRYMDIDKMYHFHMRDVSALDPHGLDVPCGTGAGHIAELFNEINNRNISPLVMIEYEHDFDNPMPYLIQSVNYINQLCEDIIIQNNTKARLGEGLKLYAYQAELTQGFRVEDEGEEATIHDWTTPDKRIVWHTNLKPGNYQVWVRYAQPSFGSAMSLVADGQELTHLFQSSFTWFNFFIKEVGVINIDNGGDVTVTLKGLQAGIRRNRDGKLVANQALPDIHWIEFVPTSLPATSQTTDILKQFKGTPLFNGKDFTGWEGNNGESSLEHFRVEKKAIVGGVMDKDLDRNQFIRTVDTYKDFELRLKYKVVAKDEDYNGGVQFRSIQSPNPRRPHEMVGYQADIISYKYGPLYDEERRNDFLGYQLLEGIPAKYKVKDWNEMIIRCEGARVRIWINGEQTTDYIEPYIQEPLERIGTINTEGHIALQIHSGKASEVWYKDIEIEVLK